MALLAALILSTSIAPSAGAQVNDIFRISNGAFGSHVEYHGIDLPPGKEFVLADLAGPGKITYFYYTDDRTSMPPAAPASSMRAWC